MILAYSHPQYLPLIEEKKTNDELSSIYESLVEGKYAIYFVFDRDFSLISYLAKAKDEATRPLLITMEINIAGNINKQKNREEDQNAVKALYLYVSEEEMRLKREDPSSFKKRYSICYDELEETLSLSPEQLRLRNKVREEFTYLEFENEAGFAGENLKGPFSISLNIAIDHNNGSFLAYVGLCRDGKLVNGASDEVLFRAILGHEKIKLPRKEGVGYLIKEEFLPGHYEALERLSAIHFAKSTTYGYAQTTKLSFGDLFEILTYLRGNSIVFDEMPVFIEETIIRADVSLLPDGSLAYIPSLKEVKSKNGKILQKGR
ncbi:MAG: hypothetical protein K5694_07035, partial [Bacilli bacterium]|nr:hypothetical protein [Bacilli bacterium]